jgi:hypothetical protein
VTSCCNSGRYVNGYEIAASDGVLGHVRDVLFADDHWRVRWLVVDTGTWLSGRKVLIHPSAITQADDARKAFQLALTIAQVEASPDIGTDGRVLHQMERGLHAYYGWSAVSGIAISPRTPSPLPYPRRRAPARVPFWKRNTPTRIGAASPGSPDTISTPSMGKSAI